MKTLLLALCLIPLSGFAQFKLEALNEKDSSVDAFLQDVEETLPASMKKIINKKVTVSFKDFNYGDKVVWGRLITNPLLPKTASHIDLNKKLLTNIRSQENYKLAKATLVHEVSHIYDAYYNVSNDQVFLNITGWKKKLLGRKKQLNTMQARRVDLYEDKNPKETFAVNIEHFLMDPAYKCRKPSLYNYLSKELDTAPFENENCEQEYRLVPTISMDGKIEKQKILDPSKLYEVHYFFAGQGKNVMSRWGHAMLRLVMCAPNRTEVSEKCLQDRAHHLVLSFRADITNFNIDYIKGLTGKYPSKMFVLSMVDVIKEYTAGELRDLYSIPLKMTEEQKGLLISQVLERYWGYESKYYFISNNCADETLNLIRNVYLDEMEMVDMNVLTPLGLKDKFEKLGLSDMSVFDNREEAKKKGYFFESLNPKLERIFSDLIEAGVLSENDRDHTEYLKNSTLAEREELLSRVNHPDQYGKLLFIEDTILNKNLMNIQKAVGKTLDEQDRSEFGGDLIHAFRKIDALKEKQSGLDLKTGYGVPLKNDNIFKAPDFTTDDAANLKTYQNEFGEEILKLFKQEQQGLIGQMKHKQKLLKQMTNK
ncbi:DUF4105 domain-containing protein [Peredibacter sp. HCB2-198]|uniref:DUF7844 domain-containing protein n=1 Tax=Peredibacter sp. HCB2-198 TaxID=3383025 RepID=UPI0038B5468D